MNIIKDCSVFFDGRLSSEISAFCMDFPPDVFPMINEEIFRSFTTFISSGYQDYTLIMCIEKPYFQLSSKTSKKTPFYNADKQDICFFDFPMREIDEIASQICLNSFASFGLLCLRNDVCELEKIASLYAKKDFSSLINYCCKHDYFVLAAINGNDGFSLCMFCKDEKTIKGRFET